MTKPINVEARSESVSVPVRKNNVRGRSTTAISATLPIELNEQLESIMETTGQSKSLVITELVQEALIQRETRRA